MFFIDNSSKISIYDQIKNQIYELIAVKALKEHDKLPSVRMLAVQLGVNPNTIQKAYLRLENEGIIYSVSGKGCYIAAIHKHIIEDKLKQFYDVVNDMYKHDIDQVKLWQIIDQIYKGGASDD